MDKIVIMHVCTLNTSAGAPGMRANVHDHDQN